MQQKFAVGAKYGKDPLITACIFNYYYCYYFYYNYLLVIIAAISTIIDLEERTMHNLINLTLWLKHR